MENSFTLNRIQKFNLDGIKYLSIMCSDLAVLHFVEKKYEKSFNYFIEALEYLDILIFQQFVDNSGKNVEEIDKLKEQIKFAREKILILANILGEAKMNIGDYAGAKEIYEVYLSYDSHNANVLFNIAICLNELGAFTSAVSFLKKSLELNPEKYEAYKLQGDIYHKFFNDLNMAIDCYEKYTENVKTDSSAYNALGYFYMSLSMFDNIEKQVECFEKAVELDETSKVAIRNLALVYTRVGNPQKSIKCYQKLLELGGTKQDIFNYGCLQFKLGNFEAGGESYEARFERETKPIAYPKMKKPKWNGKNLPQSTILVQYEQGFGDLILASRFVHLLKPLFKKVIFRVRDELLTLFRANFPDVEVVGASRALESLSFDYHIPSMSLLALFKVDVNNIPFSQGYIKPNKSKVDEYKSKFFDNDRLKIGIAWHGASNNLAYRNIPLELFYPLSKLDNVKVYSFQKGEASNKLNDLPEGVEIVDIGNSFDNFSDTAAALANVDLLISSDNVLLNLAGSMGKKAFLLLPKNTEWRWFFDDERTPWYDSVRIFRKTEENESWDTLITRVIKEIQG